ncbi:MAG TPA: hypothetical protein VG095_09515 [Chthoniobacterales bacterium]|nr:hypothetical protein [Chthoniobacterales bacterium]
MAQKKEGTEKKPGVKIQDLSPKKDAKGGFGKKYNPNAGQNLNRGGQSIEGGGQSAEGGGQSLNRTQSAE